MVAPRLFAIPTPDEARAAWLVDRTAALRAFVCERMEDAVSAGIMRGTVFAAWADAVAGYSRFCHKHPRKKARRVRMARRGSGGGDTHDLERRPL